MVVVLLVGGVQMIMLGVLGEYLWRTLEESRRRPIYSIEESSEDPRGGAHRGPSVRALVTGGAGFIGSELVRQLAARGERVVVVDNLVNGKRENVDGRAVRVAVPLVTADIRDRAAHDAACCAEATCVYHLACLGVRHSVHSPHENHEVNATATLQLLAACRDAGVPRFVYVSSSEVYGTRAAGCR